MFDVTYSRRSDVLDWDTLRLLGAIEIHRNRAVYVSLNSLLMLTQHLTLILTLTLNLILTLTLTLSEHNAFLWRPVNYNLAVRF